nr:MAG TPA: hypothetical protein [Bacteriophage sp.]
MLVKVVQVLLNRSLIIITITNTFVFNCLYLFNFLHGS